MNHATPPNFHHAVLNWLNNFAAQGMVITDRDLNIVGWNHWLEIHSGRMASDVIGRSLFDLFPSLVERRLDRWFHQALAGQSAILAQRLHRYVLPLPSVIESSAFREMQQSVRIAPLTVETEIIGTITLIEDVTERVAREHELKQQIAELQALQTRLQTSEAAQRLLAEASTLLTSSLEYSQTLVNLAQFVVPSLADWCVVHTFHAGDELELAASAHCNPDRLPLVALIAEPKVQPLPACGFMNVLTEGRSLLVPQVDTSALHDLIADAAQVALLEQLGVGSWISVPLRLRNQVLGVLTLAMAESERRFNPADLHLAEELAQRASLALDNADLYRMAQTAIRDREAYISIASHELRTPLTALIGQATLLQRRTDREATLSDRNAHSLNTIIAQAYRINSMIESLLDVSRIQTGQLTLNLQPLDLSAMLQRVANDIFPTLTTHRLHTTGLDQPIPLLGDEVRLGQVFTNLLQNAVKYAPDGGTIELAADVSTDQVVVSVRDPGLGIPVAALPNIFQRFYRVADGSTRHTSGLGIGLYVVKEIVTRHGGTIRVESEEGVGSTFIVTLPHDPTADN